MNHSNRIPTDTVDQDAAIPAGTQRAVFSSGNWLSREAFQELAAPIAPRGVEFFKLLMRTTIALEEARAGLLSAVSRNTAPGVVALLRHWLDAHALGHLALLSFRGELAWFAEMLREVTVKTWTPTLALVRERLMSVALRGAWAAGQLGETALALYLPVLRSAAEPLEHFNAVLALAMMSLKNPDLARFARPALDQWASRASGVGGSRKELMESVAFLLDDPNGARIWSMGWCRRVLSRHGPRYEEILLAKAESLKMSQDELLILTALNDVGDCGVFVDGLFPAVVLLSHVHGRSADEFYAPSRIITVLTQRWTTELGVDVLRRSVPAVDTARGSGSARGS